jgi:mRNA-degrading endonuclease YafQ of YafQ-DinJ toxin-antitoxin module
MIEIAFSSFFKRALKKNIAGKVSLETRFWERVDLFKNNPFDPKLRTHKLSGKLKELWSFSIQYDVGVIFSFAGQEQVIFVDIGSHKEVY